MLGSLQSASHAADNAAATRAANSFVYAQAVDRNGTLYFATGSHGVFIYDAKGIREINKGLATRSVYALECDNQGTLYAGTDNGVYTTTNKGTSWNALGAGLDDAAIVGLTAGTRGSVVAVSNEQQLFRIEATDRRWRKVSLDERAVTALAKDSQGNIFAGTQNGKLYRSIDNGESWRQVGDEANAEEITCLAIAGTRIIGGTRGNGVVEFRESGWHPLGGVLKSGVIHSLVSDGSSFYAGTDNGVYVLSHGSVLWTKLSDELAMIPVLSLAVSSNQMLYAGTSGFGIRRVMQSEK